MSCIFGLVLVASSLLPPTRGIARIAGPEAMVAGLTGVLNEVGVSQDSVRTEEFPGY